MKDIHNTIEQILEKHGKQEDAVLPILQAIQNEYNFLPQQALEKVCELTNITPSKITGIATFYSQFRLQPAGKHIIKVCTGTACHVKGALQVYEALRRELKLKPNEHTDNNKLFTLEKVACLGCCTIAPVVQIDAVTFGNVLPENAGKILSEFLTNKEPAIHLQQKENKNATEYEGEIRIGLGSCCVASGSAEVKNELEKTLLQNNIAVKVKHVGCVGVCNQVPILEIVKNNQPSTLYTKIKPDEVNEIILKHFKPKGFFNHVKTGVNTLLESFLVEKHPKTSKEYQENQNNSPLTEYLNPQISIATENRGIIKPTDLNEYFQCGGFEALKKCIYEYSPQQIINEILSSGLRGRGGGGFLTGKKWQMVQKENDQPKYIICNGDEGDPGAFMDRMLLESYPFRVIEGMLIAAYAVGASNAIFYIRAEYPLAVSRINEALKICEQNNLIGKNILKSNFSLTVKVFEGAGAFVCGEETALIASIEGNRGLPKLRPPYPSACGLYQKPTLINNVETFSQISWIIRNGASEFSKIGTKGSKGTKVFALAGKINRGGLIEVPMGISIREIVEKIGGGIPNGKTFKAIQIGGPSGGCIPASMADKPIDYEELNKAGAMMGSGGLIVLDETDCMVDIALYFLSFTQNQSCGRCTFCRVGTKRMHELLEKICKGQAKSEDLDSLEKLSYSTKQASLCGLGKSAPNPVLSTLKYFRHEYEAHLQGQCPAGKCTSLIKYLITDSCIGCTKCAQRCPAEAIEFKPYQKHLIDNNKCIKCDICRQICPVNSILVK